MEVISVSNLNRYVFSVLESDPGLSDLLVSGEISSCRKYSSGHFYFTLKDKNASVSCVMFKSSANLLKFEPSEGMAVVLKCKASLYQRDGKFQLYVSGIEKQGTGDLYRAFEILKDKLKKEGLFDPEHKKKIPFLPARIGVITSPHGAVIKDIINVCKRRYPGFSLLLYPSLVQGEKAAENIIEGINTFNTIKSVDVVIVGRGGGSIEDLWCFNDENLARAIYNSKIPVVSAVGHETDFTICDFVSDMRAPTPSAAAELCIPVKNQISADIEKLRKKLTLSLENKCRYEKYRIESIRKKKIFTDPVVLFERKKQDVVHFENLIERKISDIIRNKRDEIKSQALKLDSLSPLKVLGRGYAVAENPEDRSIIKSVDQINPGHDIRIRLSDGSCICECKEAERS